MADEAGTADRADALLELLRSVTAELHPERDTSSLGLDSDLGRDAGLDSLGRVELMLRVQERFGVRLSDDQAMEVATPRALLEALEHAPEAPAAAAPAARKTPHGVAPGGEPADAATLVQVLDQRAAQAPDAVHVRLLDGLDEAGTLTHAQLRDGAGAVAAGLRALGLGPGDTVAIMLPTGLDFFLAFHGVLRAGGVPIPLYPPVRTQELEGHARRLAAILDNARTRFFVGDGRTRAAGRVLQGLVGPLEHVETVAGLRRPDEPDAVVPRAADDLAFLQYTSGTTGDPKGVMLSHANLLANIRAMGPAVGAEPTDRFVSWLPLYHDMGLIGACLATLYHGIEVVLMSPLQFMTRPESWLWAIHRYGGTISAGPNFAYDLCAGRVGDDAIEGLDLSSWRLAFNGAEPVSAETIERFTARFAPLGFRAEAVMPVYGLAEASVGLAFPPPGRGARIDTVERAALEAEQSAVPASPEGGHDVLRFVSCGSVLRGHELRVVDADGAPLPERSEGRVQFRGPSCTAGYYRNERATRELFAADGWLEAGDRGYLADGEIHLTGRIKDIIIRAGRNLYPQDIEAAVAGVDGIRKNNVAAFASTAPGAGQRPVPGGRERLVVVAESRESDPARRAALREAAARAAAEVVDGGADEIVLAPPRSIPKTSSGKIRRADCRALYEADRLGRGAGTAGQAARLALAGVGAALRRAPRRVTRLAFGAWCWIAGLGMGLPSAVLVVITPGGAVRAGLARGLARLLLALTGTTPRVAGPGSAAAPGPRVVVANHASYLDGLFLRAVLPGRLCFAAKRELAGNPVVRLFLERIGVEFVERADPRQGLADLERLEIRARDGESPVVFAEGLLADGAGLRGFRMGPFVAAARAGLPVVPVALNGTRQLLRASARLPRPARVRLAIGEAIPPGGADWNAALDLRDRARAFVAEHCSEPDLAGGGPALLGSV